VRWPWARCSVSRPRRCRGWPPRQPIHNDFNIHNLLVDPAKPEQVSAILDFGDMLAAPRINDLAVAAAYQVDAEADPLGTVAAFAAAYHAESPLQAAELDLLWPLVQARLMMVVAISGWRAARQPHHADYLLRNNAVSWARLQACAAIPPPAARAALLAACGC
jgi:hydroxylysine kinase